MGYITKEEENLIRQYIDNGYESSCVDYKVITYFSVDELKEYMKQVSYTSEYYDKDKKDKEDTKDKKYFSIKRYNIIKDCLAFLNLPSFNDKYILMGINDKREVIGLKEKLDKRYASDLVKYLQDYIEPIPKVEFFTLEMEDEKKIGVLKLNRGNIDFPYLLKKEIKYIENEKIHIVAQGSSFIRSGSTNRNLGIEDWKRYLDIRENSLMNLVYLRSENLNNIYVRYLIEILNKVINKKIFEEFSYKEKILLEKFNSIIAGINTINEKEYEFNSSNNFTIKHLEEYINQGIEDYSKIISILDNGIHSQLIKIFIFAYKIYELDNSKYCDLEFSSNTLVITLKKDIPNNVEYNLLKNKISNIKEIYKSLRNISEENNYYNMIKLVDVECVDLAEEDKQFADFSAKFEVSNKIIPLLIGPLYGEDSMYIGARELLQNAIDACKEGTQGEIKVCLDEIKLENGENSIQLKIQDNGIGMTRNVLKNSYFNIGTSTKGDSKVGLVGKFGIGVLSGFLMGDYIKVCTKSKEEPFIYEFSLKKPTEERILNEQDEYENVISSKYCEDNTSGTSIELMLDSRITDAEQAMKVLRFDDWAVCEDIAIRIFINGNEEKLVPNLLNKSIPWDSIELKNIRLNNMSSNEIEVKIYVPDDELANNICRENKELKSTYDFIESNKKRVIYNGILIDFKYEGERIKKTSEIPLILIKDISKRQYNKDSEIFIPLDREYIKIRGSISNKIEEWLYQNEYKNLNNYLLSPFEKNRYTSMYFEDMDIIYTSKGFGLDCGLFKNYIHSLGYKELITIYAPNYKLIGNKIGFKDDRAYIMKNTYWNKKELADLIEGYGISNLFISWDLIESYFLDSSSRMRIGANCEVLNSFIKMSNINGSYCKKADGKNVIDMQIDNSKSDILEYKRNSQSVFYTINQLVDLDEISITDGIVVRREVLHSNYYSISQCVELERIYPYKDTIQGNEVVEQFIS